MRTVYIGSSAFAVEVLKVLAASPHRPALVVTPPDRPKGRGRRTSPPPAALAARELGLELAQTPSVNESDALAAIERAAPQVVCVCEFGQLIKEPLLSHYLILNVHPSLLPRWRGAAPIERALMEGDPETGVTIFQITEGLDSGPMALAASEPIQGDDTAGTLSARLAALGGRLLVEALDRDEGGTLELTEQPEEGVTYAHKIGPHERRLDPTLPAPELERHVRALTPHIGAYVAFTGDKRLGVERARATEAPLEQGAVDCEQGLLRVGCAEGSLELLEVRPPGKRTMPAAEYLRGHRPPARLDSG
jgi:methionyl-tRNA formyltransferase